MALQKRDALEYLDRQAKPVTAKELAVDLDTRQSTASEMLERATSQGLVKRDADRRPREYQLTDAGRKRLAYFRALKDHGQQAQSPGSLEPSHDFSSSLESDTASESVASLQLQEFEARMEDFEQRLAGMAEDYEELISIVAAPEGVAADGDASAEGRAAALLKRVEALAQRKVDHPKVREYYEAYRTAKKGPWFSPLRGRDKVAALEAGIPSDVVPMVKRLCELEGRELPLSTDEEKEADQLRVQLGLSHDAESRLVQSASAD